MSNRFSTKKVVCEDEDVHLATDRLQLEWLRKFLLRLKADPDKIERALNDPTYLNQDWRDYLLIKFGVDIIYNMGDKSVTVVKIHENTREEIKLAEWKKPEIIRVKNKAERYCELHLKYWSLI